MTTKQILLSALLLGATNNIALAMEKTQKDKAFADKDMQTKSEKPGERASREYPRGYRIAKTTGGAIGALTSATVTAMLCSAADFAGSIISRGGSIKPPSKLAALAVGTSSLCFGWMGGTGISKNVWNATWYTNEKIKNLKNLIEKE